MMHIYRLTNHPMAGLEVAFFGSDAQADAQARAWLAAEPNLKGATLEAA
jgi:hypothetical protein